MPLLRLGLAQVDPVVGDLEGNARLIREAVAEAARAGAQVVATGEMALTGYPIEDLALRHPPRADCNRYDSLRGLHAAA